MNLLLVGMNHLTAPVELREQMFLPPEEEKDFLREAAGSDAVKEVLYLSTCNRVEMLASVYDLAAGEEAFKRLLSLRARLSPEDISRFLYIYRDEGAIRHLFRVSASLDSMIMGEPQILGQVKDAYRKAVETKTISAILGKLLHQAFRAAKRVRSETALGENPLSISNAAVNLAKKIFGELKGKTVLLVGAGEMSELAARQLFKYGVERLLVANRTYSRAEQLASQFQGRPVPFDLLGQALAEADIVIASTMAPGYVITGPLVAQGLRSRAGRFLFLIDIAVPRDIDPVCGEIENVFLYNIDNLQEIVDENFLKRTAEVRKAEIIIEEEILKYRTWLDSLQAVPTINALIGKIEGISREELARCSSWVQNLNEDNRRQVSVLVESIVNKILHDPITVLKEETRENGADLYISTLRRLFKL